MGVVPVDGEASDWPAVLDEGGDHLAGPHVPHADAGVAAARDDEALVMGEGERRDAA